MKKFTLLLCALLMLSLVACKANEASAPLPTAEIIPATEPMSNTAETTMPPTATDAYTESSSAEETTIAPTTEETNAVSDVVETTAPAEIEATVPSTSESETPKAPIIETKYYTLTLPDEWKEGCFYSVVDGITVTLREKSGYEAFGGGKLCTLMLMSTDDDTYKDFPDYELLCALNTPDGSFYVIALFPTDVQFNGETAESYNAMAAELRNVLYRLEALDGIEMAMP